MRYSSGTPEEGYISAIGVAEAPSYVRMPGNHYWDGNKFIDGRSISPNFVEHIIRTVKPRLKSGNKREYISGSIKIVTSEKGRVITIINEKGK